MQHPKRKFRLIKNLNWQDPVSSNKGLKRISMILEEGSVEEMRRLKSYQEALISFHWRYYQELALQRERIKDQLFNSLRSSALSDFKFENYQRAVKYKYSLHPFCAVGSLTPPGGRFNVGDVNSSIRSVPALYLAEDKDTALQETLGQEPAFGNPLSPQELALTNPQSESIVAMSGKVESLLDLSTSRPLAKFINLMRNFKISVELKREAKNLNILTPDIIKTPAALHDILLAPNWRHLAALFDIPWNSQIFGNICAEAGLQGIIYPSSKNSKKCIVIYPENIKDSDAEILISDEAPSEVKVKRIDARNYHTTTLTYDQL